MHPALTVAMPSAQVNVLHHVDSGHSTMLSLFQSQRDGWPTWCLLDTLCQPDKMPLAPTAPTTAFLLRQPLVHPSSLPPIRHNLPET